MTRYLLILGFLFSFSIQAQIDCGLNYYLPNTGNQIMSFNPVTNTHTNTGINLPAGAGGLAISENLNGGSPSPTFYTVVNGIYWYWNGSTWVNTGHSSGHLNAVNPGGSGPYIYNLNGLAGAVYRYDGTGNSVLVTNLPGYGGPYDLIGDSQGNFYVLHANGGNQSLSVYNPSGQLICTYSISGLPSASAGGGYSVVNGVIYANINTGTYQGVFNGNSITFSPSTHYNASDYGSCAFPPFNTVITSSTNNNLIDMCIGDTITLTASTNITNPTFAWTGPGIVSGAATTAVLVYQPGTYTLVVNSGSGSCAATTTTDFTLVASSSSATIDPQAPICLNGSSVQLTASSSGDWSASCGACITSTGSFNPAIAGVGTHTITLNSAGSCTSTTTSTVVVNGLPTVSAGQDQTVCAGESVTLTGQGTVDYTWDNDVLDGVPFSVTTTTTYTVTGTDANNCSNTDQVIVNVGSLAAPTFNQVAPICLGGSINPLPTTSVDGVTGTWSPAINNAATTIYTFTPTNPCISNVTMTIVVSAPTIDAGIDTAVCSGIPLTLTATSSDLITWNNGVSNGVSFTPTGTFNYQATATDTNGCQATDEILVTVNPNPIVNAGDDQVVCPGTTIVLTGSGATDYMWTNGVSDGVSFVPTSTATYTVTGVDLNNCSDTDQVTITVGTQDVATFNQITPICVGDPLSLPATSINNVSGSWSPAPNNMATTTYTFTPSDLCASTVTMTIDVNPLPTINAGQDIVLCEGSMITLLATGASSITWNNGVQNNVPFVPTVGVTSYEAIGVDANGCQNSDIVQVTIYPNPIASFTINNSDLSSLNSMVEVTNTSVNATSYEWNFGDHNSTYFTTNPTHTYPEGYGGYTIQLIAINGEGCRDTTERIVIVREDLLYFIPNAFTPDGDEFNQVFKPIFTSGFDPYDYTLTIYNRWGEKVFESQNVLIGWDGTYAGVICPTGTYTWAVEFKTSNSDERKSAHGHLNLLR